ncbi:MAG TPA: SRPBCC domain-containing protein [Candidatus Obscuribacterales bacterium]
MSNNGKPRIKIDRYQDPERILHMTRRFEAAPEVLFDAWVRARNARYWLFATGADERYEAGFDARIGGRYHITVRRKGFDFKAVGEYLEVEWPHRLVFTYGMPQFAPDFDHISVELATDGEGCLMSFTQAGMPPDYRSATEEGWKRMFDLLEQALQTGLVPA